MATRVCTATKYHVVCSVKNVRGLMPTGFSRRTRSMDRPTGGKGRRYGRFRSTDENHMTSRNGRALGLHNQASEITGRITFNYTTADFHLFYRLTCRLRFTPLVPLLGLITFAGKVPKVRPSLVGRRARPLRLRRGEHGRGRRGGGG